MKTGGLLRDIQDHSTGNRVCPISRTVLGPKGEQNATRVLTSDLFPGANGLDNVKPLLLSVLLRRFENDGPAKLAGIRGSKNTSVLVGNAWTQTIHVRQAQRRGVVILLDDADVFALDFKVTIEATNAEAIIDVLTDTVGWEDNFTLHISRNDTELELLESLVAGNTCYQIVTSNFSRHIGIEFVAQ